MFKREVKFKETTREATAYKDVVKQYTIPELRELFGDGSMVDILLDTIDELIIREAIAVEWLVATEGWTPNNGKSHEGMTQTVVDGLNAEYDRRKEAYDRTKS